MCIKWIKSLFNKESNDEEEDTEDSFPTILEPLDINEVYTVLTAELGDKCAIFLSDSYYETTTKDKLQKFLKLDNTDQYEYKKEIFDCDDFSYRLVGNLSIPGWASLPFGILWTYLPNGSGHALNIFIDTDSEVWIVEPQNDNIYKMPKNWKPIIVMM